MAYNMAPLRMLPNMFTSSSGDELDVQEVLVFDRSLTYGQIKGIRSLLRLVKRLNAKSKLVDIDIRETDYGQPGFPSRYKIHMSYRK